MTKKLRSIDLFAGLGGIRLGFENYLLNSTYLETGSTARHNFATIYKEKDSYFINMNVQIRFKA